MKVREPVERPLDVVAVELLLSASQAYVAGVLMYLAVGFWADRGVGLGPVAVILALLSLAVGASWLFWLLGGSGWPLAATSVPVAMFAGFSLVLGITGDRLISLEPLPLLLLIASSAYGVIGGVFLDSPRRWRWDQRRALRPGTKVPRVSPTTKALAAKMPRSLPRRSTATEPGWPAVPAAGGERLEDPASSASATSARPPASATSARPPAGRESDEPAGASTAPGTGRSSVVPDGAPGVPTRPTPSSGTTADPAARSRAGASTSAGAATPTGAASPATPKSAASPRPASASAPAAQARSREDGKDVVDRAADGSIELPTSVEPKPQRSPWAWAAPPEWNREDDDDDRGSSRGKKP